MTKPENPTPPQVTPEIKAVDLSHTPDIQETKTKESLIRDMVALAERMKERVDILNNLLEKESDNPELNMAKQLVDWRQLKRNLIGIPNDLIEYSTLIKNGDYEIAKFLQHLGGLWPEIQNITVAGKRLEAYIKPLINEQDTGTLTIRALSATLNDTSADIEKNFRPYGIEWDQVEILAPAPKNAKINRENCEGFLFMGGGNTLPLTQMHALIIGRQKKSTDPIVTDIRKLGWSSGGERRQDTEVIPYQEGTWLTAMRRGTPNFRTSKQKTE